MGLDSLFNDRSQLANKINVLNGNVGDPTQLQTTDKSSLVNAANELHDQIGNLSNNLNGIAINAMYPPAPLIGCKSDGTTDDTITFQNIVNSLLTTGGTLYLPRGTGAYKINGSISGAFTGNINIIADPGVVIDGTLSTATNLITLGGSQGSSSPLTASVTKGTRTIQSALTVNSGDIVLITSTDLFDTTRSYFYKGELAEVESANSGIITLKSPLYDNYNSSTTTIYKLITPKVSISNLTILRNSNQAGLIVQYARDISLKNISVSGSRDRGIQVGFYVYGGVIKNCYVTDCWYSGSGTSYGLVIASSQAINVIGGRYIGGRHGISHGGNEPVRNITISGATIGNHSQATAPSFDIHGNGDYINVHDCTILNGAEITGSVKFTNNKVYSSNGITYGVIWYGERSVEYVDITGNYVNTSALTSSWGIYIQPTIANLTINNVNISNNTIYSQSSGIYITPSGGSVTGFVVNKLMLENNYVSNTGSSAYALQIVNNGSATVEVDDLQIVGGTYIATTYRSMYVSLVETGNMRFDDVTFVNNQTSNYGVIIADGNNVIFSKCLFQGASASPYSAYNAFGCAGNLQLLDCIFTNFSSKSGIQFDGTSPVTKTPAMAVLRGNTFTNVSGNPATGAVKTVTQINANNSVVGHGTATPTAGAWSIGDRIFNSTPAVGSPKSWVCTVTGTPGTWVSEGNL